MQCRTPLPSEQIRSQIFQDCSSIKSQLHLTADGNPTLRTAALTLSARACGFLYTLALAFETLRKSNLPTPAGIVPAPPVEFGDIFLHCAIDLSLEVSPKPFNLYHATQPPIRG